MKFKEILLIFISFTFFVVDFNLYSEEKGTNADSKFNKIESSKIFEDNAEIENLKRENYEGIDNLISVYSGIDINVLGYPGQFSSFNYRGLNHKGISFSIDGIPVDSYIFGVSDLNRIPTEMIDTVYFYRYSVFNPGYLEVDFHTKSISGGEPFTRIVYRIGDYERSFVDLFFKRKLTNLSDIGVSGSFEKYPGQFGEDNYFGRKFWVSYKREISKDLFLKFSGIYIKRGVDLPSEIVFTKKLVSHNSRADNNSGMYNLSLNRNNEGSRFNLYLYFNGYKRRFRNILKENKIVVKDTIYVEDKENIYGSGFSYRKRLDQGDISLKFNLSAYSIKGDKFPEIKNKNKVSTFLNYRYFYRERLIFNPYFAIFNDSIRGRINQGGISFHSILSENFGTFFSYRLSGRYPDIQELYYEGIELNGRTDLKNEKSDSFEMGIRYKSKNNFISGSIYRETIDNMISFDISKDSRSFLPFNDKRYSFWGTEFDLSSSFLKFFQIIMRYSYAGNRDKNSFLFNPDIKGYFSFVINDLEDIFIKGQMSSMVKFTCKYFGEEYLKYYNPAVRDFALSKRLTESSFVFDFKAIVTIKTLTFIYEVDNVFGEDFVEVYGYPVPRGTIRIGIQWDFFD
ncbi:MAG: TonB-dependent receptor [Candidatus Helarchaeota archaeon]|nr:TonB-dependent receptor [Candidatus Helarchaeota archaeon]